MEDTAHRGMKPCDRERTDIDRYQDMAASSHTGWWESNMRTRQYRFSSNICELLGFDTPLVEFDRLMDFVREDYRDLLHEEFFEFSQIKREFYKRAFPVNTVRGEVWVQTLYVKPVIHSDGSHGSFGVITVVSPDAHSKGLSVVERTNKFLKQMDKVSLTVSNFLVERQEYEVINSILESVSNFYNADNSYIFEFSDDGCYQGCTHEFCAEGAKSLKSIFPQIDNKDLPWLTSKMMSRRHLVLGELTELPPEAEAEYKTFSDLGIKSLLMIPLIDGARVWGYFGIDCMKKSHQWTNEDYLWLLSMGNILSICVAITRSRENSMRNQEYADNLIKNMPIGFGRLRLIFDEAGKVCDYLILEGNPAGYKMYGLETHSENILCSELHGKEYAAQRKAFLQDLYDNSHYVENDEVLPTGKHCHKITYISGNDEVIEFYIDTTERVHAFSAARRSNKLFRDIFINIPIGEAIYNMKGELKDMNKAFMDTFGMTSLDDAAGYSFFQDSCITEKIRNMILNADTSVFILEYSFDDNAGKYKTFRKGKISLNCKIVKLYDEDSTCFGYLLIAIEENDHIFDQNRVRDFENFFSMISDYAKIGYAKYNICTMEGYAIRQWYKNMGEDETKPLNEIVGVYDQMHPDDRKRLLKFFDDVKTGKGKDFVSEIRIHRPGSVGKWNYIYKNLLVTSYAPEDEKIEVIGVNYDITAFKEIENELIEARDKAQTADNLKSMFLANMSHEIRTPLNAIVGFSDLLVDTDDIEERKQYISILHENNELLLQLINDILDLSKMESGMVDMNYSEVDIHELCSDIAKSMRLKLKDDSEVKIIFDAPQQPCLIHADRNRLNQVLCNFVNNSIKFTDKGYIKIGYQWTDESHIKFYVQDTGIGIDKVNLDRVFDRFVKLNSFIQGTGLGLSICSAIIAQMKGTIGADSAKGEGSTFWFILPAVKRDNAAGIPHNPLPRKRKSNTKKGIITNRLPIVLIAEDTESSYILARSILKDKYTIYRAIDGVDAVNKAMELHPDLILMDLQMPRMNGFDATRSIREFDTSVPIIALTAFAFEKDKVNSIKAGCTGYITKPVSSLSLKQKVKEELERTRRED